MYDYQGILFELGPNVGPTILNRKTLGEREHVPMSMWRKLDEWQQLDEAERESYRVEQPEPARTTESKS